MARRTKLREAAVVDSDFTTEAEAQGFIDSSLAQHLIDHPHTALEIPIVTGHEDEVLSTDGITYFWAPNLGGGVVDGVPVEPYYEDVVRNRYLSFSTIVIDFYMDGSNKKKIYTYQVPGVSSLSVPFRVFGEQCCVGYHYYSNTLASNGVVMSLMNTDTSTSLLDITLGATPVSEQVNDTADILIPDATKVGCYVGNTGLDNPVLRVYLKKTYYPTI